MSNHTRYCTLKDLFKKSRWNEPWFVERVAESWVLPVTIFRDQFFLVVDPAQCFSKRLVSCCKLPSVSLEHTTTGTFPSHLSSMFRVSYLTLMIALFPILRYWLSTLRLVHVAMWPFKLLDMWIVLLSPIPHNTQSKFHKQRCIQWEQTRSVSELCSEVSSIPFSHTTVSQQLTFFLAASSVDSDEYRQAPRVCCSRGLSSCLLRYSRKSECKVYGVYRTFSLVSILAHVKVLRDSLLNILFVMNEHWLWKQSSSFATRNSQKFVMNWLPRSIRLIRGHQLDPDHLACLVQQRQQGQLRGATDLSSSNHIVTIYGSCWPLIASWGQQRDDGDRLVGKEKVGVVCGVLDGLHDNDGMMDLADRWSGHGGRGCCCLARPLIQGALGRVTRKPRRMLWYGWVDEDLVCMYVETFVCHRRLDIPGWSWRDILVYSGRRRRGWSATETHSSSARDWRIIE